MILCTNIDASKIYVRRKIIKNSFVILKTFITIQLDFRKFAINYELLTFLKIKTKTFLILIVHFSRSICNISF